MEICFSDFFNMRITVNLLLMSSFLPKWKFFLLFGNSCSYPVLERNDMWHHSKVLGIYDGFHAIGVNRLQSGGRDECQVEKYHREYLSGAARNTWLQFSDAGIQRAVTRQKKWTYGGLQVALWGATRGSLVIWLSAVTVTSVQSTQCSSGPKSFTAPKAVGMGGLMGWTGGKGGVKPSCWLSSYTL